MSGTSATLDREMVITRLVNAPRELVFNAWTDPQQIAQWWGPSGFTTTIHTMDVRAGGIWRYIMHGPDGVDYKNKTVYLEIAKPERLVYLHNNDEEGDPGEFHVTTTFVEEGGKTRVTMRAVFASAEECAKVKEFGAVEGGSQTLERLDEYLAALPSRPT